MKTLLVIFGITGDLSTRKLLPALGHIVRESKVPGLQVLGVSRRDVDVKDLVLSTTQNTELAEVTDLLTMDVARLADYEALKAKIADYDADQVLVYLSVPPGAATQIVDLLGEASVNTPNIRLLFEKPFGFDLESAKDFISRTSRYFNEAQLYRIDHYMAKEVSAELLRLRRNAENVHHHWGADTIESVSIVASEKIGIEGRAQFYEQTGALRDFVQGHLLQLLSLVLMTRPTVDADLPEQRLAALAALQGVDPAHAIRAQYQGYQEEAGNIGSTVETYVALELKSNDANWLGVPLRLITGKALNEKRSYVEIHYKDGSTDMFEEGAIAAPGGVRHLDAYERVLLEAIKGNKELFTTSEEVIRAWQLLAAVQHDWMLSTSPLQTYAPGATVFLR